MSRPEVVDEAVPAPRALQYVVRFGSMRTLGVMDARQTYRYGDQIVARTTRGTELGTVLCEATPVALESVPEPTEGRIVRRASADDLAQCRSLEARKGDDVTASGRAAQTLGLEMEVVDVERILGGERVVVYFLSEGRIDFRQLVRDLSAHFQTRIEMRQIGVRDEAKLLADYGDCGRPICCASFLSKMPPVSMKMAKLQKATLDPSKISGRCGRLKCCLRYEYDTYEAISRELPAPGSVVLTRDGNVTVIAQDILSQQLMVKTDDNRRILIHCDDILSLVTPTTNTDQAGRTKSNSNSSSTSALDD